MIVRLFSNNLPSGIIRPSGLWGDGIHLDTAVLNEAIQSLNGGMIVLPPNATYLIDDSLDFSGKKNISLYSPVISKYDSAAKIRWAEGGDPSKPMIKGAGAQKIYFHGIDFLGNNTDDPDDLTGLGAYLYSGSSYSSQWIFEKCGFKYFAVGVQVGDTSIPNSNNEFHVFRDCNISYCTTGYRQYWPNSLNEAMYGCDITFCTTGMHLGNPSSQAGSLQLYNHSIGHNTIDFYFENGCRLDVYGLRGEESEKFINAPTASNSKQPVMFSGAEIINGNQSGTYFVTFNHGILIFINSTLGDPLTDPFLIEMNVSRGRCTFVGCDLNNDQMSLHGYAGLTQGKFAFYGSRGFSSSTSAYMSIADGERVSENPPFTHLYFPSKDTTPSVKEGNFFKTYNLEATTYTDFDDGYMGQTIRIMIGDNNCTFDFTGTHLKGNGGSDWTPSAGAWLEATFDGADWYCVVHD